MTLSQLFSRKTGAGIALIIAMSILYLGSNGDTPSTTTSTGWWSAVFDSPWVYVLSAVGLLITLVALAVLVHYQRERGQTIATTPTPATAEPMLVAGESENRDWVRLGMVATGFIALLTLSFFLTEAGAVRYFSWAMLGVLVFLLGLFWHQLGRPAESASPTYPPAVSSSSRRDASPTKHSVDSFWALVFRLLLFFIFFTVVAYLVRHTWGADILEWDVVKNLEYLNEFEETARMWRVSAVVGAIATLALVAVVCSRFLLICLILAVLALGLYNCEEIGQSVATSVCETFLGNPVEGAFGELFADEDDPCRRSGPSN
jgi:hypothetical protein